MEMTIKWSKKARTQVRQIFDYYQVNASTTVAESIISNIKQRTRILATQPKMGRRYKLLSDMTIEIRYLIIGNYKILYWMDGSAIIISTVFDCRRDPEKLSI